MRHRGYKQAGLRGETGSQRKEMECQGRTHVQEDGPERVDSKVTGLGIK